MTFKAAMVMLRHRQVIQMETVTLHRFQEILESARFVKWNSDCKIPTLDYKHVVIC